ncbi:MAG: putative esterase, partial [Litorivivens sp.]
MKREAEVSRHRKGSNFGEAQSVAVVYNESDENHFKKVKSFVKFLHDEHGIRKIMAFGYSDADPKNLPHWLS